MQKLFSIVLFCLISSYGYSQSKKEIASQFVDNLKKYNSKKFAYSKGNFVVGDNGAMNYEIPIVCVQGAAGMTPKIALNYNSNGGSGIVGEGWNLSGLSVITRTSQNLAIDNKNGRIEFNENDRLILDGQRLVNIESASYWADAYTRSVKYLTEQNTFKQIISYYTNDRINRFEVRTKDGLVYHYGAVGDGQKDIDNGYYLKTVNNEQIISWLLVRIEDRNQNVIDIEYDKMSLSKSFIKPTIIHYTGRKLNTASSYFAQIVFNYIKVPAKYKYISGQKIQFDEILSSISCEYKDPTNFGTIRTYKLEYLVIQDQKKYYLKSVKECLNDGDCLVTDFSWQAAQHEAVLPNAAKYNTGQMISEDYQIHTGDFNGDGLLDNVGLKIFPSKVHLLYNNNVKGTFGASKSVDLNLKMPQDTRVVINDFDANGTSDIAFCWLQDQKIHFQVAYSVASLKGTDIKIPTIGSLTSTSIDKSIKKNEIFYASNDFNGDGLPDIYCYYYKDHSVKLIFGLNNTLKEFTVKPIKSIPTTFKNGLQNDTIPDDLPINLGDYNSDGISDLLFTWLDSKGWNTKVYLLDENLLLSGKTSRVINNENSSFLPLNVTQFKTKSSKEVIDSMEVELNSFVSIKTSSYNLYKNKNLPITKAVYTLDVNQDGNSDLLVSNQNSKGWKTWVLLGMGNGDFEEPRETQIDDLDYKYLCGQSFGDFNGDGQIDICITFSNENGWFVKIAYGTGSGLFPSSSTTQKLDGSNFSYYNRQRVKGMLDIDKFVKSFPEISAKRLKKFNGDVDAPTNLISNLDGAVAFFADKMWRNQIVPTSSFGTSTEEYFDNYTFVDKPKDFGENVFNFKRIQSITQNIFSSKISISRNKLHSVNGEGDPLCYQDMENISVSELVDVKFVDFWKPIVADLDGDGITDFALTYCRQPETIGATDNLLNGEWKIFVAINKAKKSGKVEKVIHGNSSEITVCYASTIKDGAFDTDQLVISYPNVPYNATLNVVESVTSPDGVGGLSTVRYVYKNPIIGITGRGFFGFEKSEVSSQVNDRKSYKSYLIDSAFLSLGIFPLRDAMTKIGSSVINREVFKNAIFEVVSKKVIFNYIEFKLAESFSLDKTLLSSVESNYEYDKYGNLIRSETNYPNGQKDMIINEYYETSIDGNDDEIKNDNLNRWVIGRLKSTTISKQKNSADQLNRRSEFIYYPITGQLKEERNLVGTYYEVHKKYFYDERGNKIKEDAFPYKNTSEVVSTTYEYNDTHKRFLTRKIDGLNYITSFKPNIIFGFNEETTDPNGNIVKLDFQTGNFDAFGRDKKIILSDKNWSRETNYRCDSCDVKNAVYFKVSSSSVSTTPEIAFYDVFDRPIKTISFDLNYNMITKNETFDKNGLLTSSSSPYFDKNTPSSLIYYSTFEYDKLGRTTKITNPDGTINRFKYEGLKTITTNNRGQTSILINDVLGRKRFEINHLNDTVSYEYDLDWNQVAITDQSGRTFIYNYDRELGKLESAYSPNSGQRTSYKYNYWGEIEELRTGYLGNIVTNFVYDKIGRVKIRTEKRSVLPGQTNAPDNKIEDKIEYIYIGAEEMIYGKGRLKAVKVTGDDRKLSKTFEFDQYGKLIKKSFSFENYVGGAHDDTPAKIAWNSLIGNGKTIDIKYSYNSGGQIETIQYPKLNTNNYKKDFIVRYNYENGNVKSVLANSTMVWEYVDGNAAGMPTRIAYNNGKTHTQYTFNSLNQNLESIVTFSNGNAKVQNWNYKYDDIQNVVSRVELFNSQTFNETYVYDDLNRVSTMQVNGVVQKYQYDRLGNIIYRSDLGYFRDRDDYFSNEKSKERKITINKDYANSIKNDEGLNGDIDDIEYYFDLVGNRYKKEVSEEVQFVINFNHFNKPDLISNRNSGKITSYFYDEENNMQIEDKDGRIKYFIDGIFEFEFISGFKVNQKFYVAVGSELVSYNDIANNIKDDRFIYLHKDALGSITAITDDKGKATVFCYDIWGRRLDPKSWKPIASGFSKGFTGHEHLDEIGLINMGGRLFDPQLAQFLQVDPVLNLENPTLGLTAYAYCYNNPLYYTDPSGYLSVGKFLGGVARGVVRAVIAGPTAPLLVLPQYSNFVDKNAGTIVTVQGIVVSAILTPMGVPPAVTGFATGFASSFAQTYLNGGSLGQALEVGMISGTISGVTAGITSGIGATFMGADGSGTAGLFGDNYWANLGGKAVSHAAFQGAMNEVQGGSFKDGAISAFAAAAGSHFIGQIEGNDISSSVQRTAIAATIGGTTSAIGGGKFGNGAMTAAIVHMYNFEATKALHHYRTGRGATYNLSDEEFNSLKNDPNAKVTGPIREKNGVRNQPVSFYSIKSPNNFLSIGSGTFCLDNNGNRIGFYDFYNFNSRQGERSFSAEAFTRAGGFLFKGDDYIIQYNNCKLIP